MKKLPMAFIAILFPAIAYASDDQYVREYLARLESTKTAVFSTECQLRTVKSGKAELVLPVGEKQGLYIERNEKTVVNTADVSLVDGKWTVTEALGGVYTITRVNNLVKELLAYPFQLIQPENLQQIATSKPKRACVEKLPE